MYVKKIGSLSLSAALLLAACSQTTTNAPTAQQPAHFVVDPTHSFISNQVVVGLEQGVTAESAAAKVGGRVLRALPHLNAALISLPNSMSVQKAVRIFANSDLARYAEPNYLMTRPDAKPAQMNAQSVTAQATLNDPQLGRQWFLNNMGVYKAWETATGKGIRIGIADEDIDRHHPDLYGNMVFPGYDAPNGTLITDQTPYDGTGDHGTWVSGTAAAVGNNGIGGAGVAREAGIVPLTITHDPTGASNVDSAMAFIFGVVGPDDKAPSETGDTDTPAGHNGYVDIINYSFGGSNYSQLSKEAIDFVLAHKVVFVTSAGNTPTTGPASPAWTPGAISVAATTPRDERTDFSNRGWHLSVGAPGENIWVTAVRNNPSDPNEVHYSYVNGTSFASPATAGAAALILQASASKNADGTINKINLTPAQVRHILEDTAYKPTGAYSTDVGNGVVRADKAVLRATQDAANTVEKGASVSMRFVAASNPNVGVPLVGVTMAGGKRPDQLLYAQSAAGDAVFETGTVNFFEVDAGLYKLYASGPRTVIAGGTTGNTVQTVDLAPGDDIIFGNASGVFPISVTLPTDAFEPNNTLAEAKSISFGQARDAVLDAGDADIFTFSGTAGERAFVNTQAVSGNADTKVEILDSAGTVLASNSAFRSGTTDAALVFDVPSTGQYYIRVTSDSAGNPFNTYWVSLSRLVGQETEPNGTGTITDDVFANLDLSATNTLNVGETRDGALSAGTDVDIYAFSGTAGQKLLADINTEIGGDPDTILAIVDANGKTLASNDDTKSQDSTVQYTLTAAGQYYLVVGNYGGQNPEGQSNGKYRVTLTQR
ncbi:S8 family serine peptidase [Deinococcus maricopensis]|uniref:Peptidase S8 and S53 subtilisin kexin sedolisin n=1 Tax=Deinococcus maricopensis (strain DSM 21211 / LMG 22137 / NRRL B-23946 / LB-34) TaxID=709986 RepID=E8U4F6_DEIML|nr:S8 family serine peptidase [Deinococcus maricopensis]ADV68821.1 peptidase S8 and S53 subtilisin kexin sedolisin [Deinococcus maricopensis DSM 21211]